VAVPRDFENTRLADAGGKVDDNCCYHYEPYDDLQQDRPVESVSLYAGQFGEVL